jgi:hypothetical protein
MKRRRDNHVSAPSAAKSALMKTKQIMRMKMNKLFRLIFQPYVEDEYGAYYHSGVGYTGVSYSPDRYARKKHHGVGYTGVYDE